MKVIENKAMPTLPPPSTFDLTGLTEAEFLYLRTLVGRTPDDGTYGREGIGRRLYSEMSDKARSWNVVTGS